jgi:hypothetical protein
MKRDDHERLLQRAWADHGDDPRGVCKRVDALIPALHDTDHLVQVVRILTHLYGVHFGEIEDGIEALKRLRAHPVWAVDSPVEHAIARSIVSLELAADPSVSLDALSLSDKIQALAAATGALTEQGKHLTASSLLRQAVSHAALPLPPGDGAYRALAVAGNNLAAAFEELPLLDHEQRGAMLMAAHTGRVYWEKAGTWLEVERAEYRLSRSSLKGGDPEGAMHHAQACIRLCDHYNAPALEMFFGIEALALALQAKGHEVERVARLKEKAEATFSALAAEDQHWCAPTLAALRTL